MDNNSIHSNGADFELIVMILLFVAVVLYFIAAIRSNRQYRSWPLRRYFFWSFGILCAATAIIGPLANRAHIDFKAHMIGHLLLGMLAPLLLVLAAPMTLILRTLSLQSSRGLSCLLKSSTIRIVSDPMIASLLNVGGLYVLYTTDLFMNMHESVILHIIVHLHVFLAGYIFTMSMIHIDLSPHRTSYMYRAIVMVFAFAGHSILAKYMYAHPPAGVLSIQAETGAMIMYYGGDVIDIAMIVILCYQWFKKSKPRKLVALHKVT